MLQVARLSPRVLGEAAELVAGFLRDRINGDGGFQDRSGKSDLYYTVFGMEALLALRADLPAEALAGYLRSFGDGESLDLVHLASLARAWADLPRGLSREAPRERILERLEALREEGGGYRLSPGAAGATAYSVFLALGAYQDLGQEPRDLPGLLASLGRLRARDGGYSNQPEMARGLTPPTAAAATVLRQLGGEPEPALGRWLLSRVHPQGGFLASPEAPIPDLLSTATALHALAGMQVPLDGIREPCLDFIDSLWTNRGGFYGHWSDDVLDCEYTYYALLALGHLSL